MPPQPRVLLLPICLGSSSLVSTPSATTPPRCTERSWVACARPDALPTSFWALRTQFHRRLLQRRLLGRDCQLHGQLHVLDVSVWMCQTTVWSGISQCWNRLLNGSVTGFLQVRENLKKSGNLCGQRKVREKYYFWKSLGKWSWIMQTADICDCLHRQIMSKKQANLWLPLNVQKLEVFQLQGAFPPSLPPDQGVCCLHIAPLILFPCLML